MKQRYSDNVLRDFVANRKHIDLQEKQVDKDGSLIQGDPIFLNQNKAELAQLQLPKCFDFPNKVRLQTLK